MAKHTRHHISGGRVVGLLYLRGLRQKASVGRHNRLIPMALAGVCMALLCLLAPSAALGQCSTTGWHEQQQGGGGVFCTANVTNNPTYYGYTFTCVFTLTPLQDPLSGYASPNVAIGSHQGGTQSITMNGGTGNTCFQVYPSGNGGAGLNGNRYWPDEGPITEPQQDHAYYQFSMNCSGGGTGNTYILNVWWVGAAYPNGTWSFDPPSATPLPTPPTIGSPPTGATQDSVLQFTVTRDSDGAYLPGLQITYQGYSAGSLTTTGTGSVTSGAVYAGTYTIELYGRFTTTNGGIGNADQIFYVSVQDNQTAKVFVTLKDNGTIGSLSGGGTSGSTGGSSGGGGGSGFPTGNSFWGDLYTYLFVPQQQSIQNCRNDLNSIASWGPFAMLNSLLGWQQLQATQQQDIGIAVPYPEIWSAKTGNAPPWLTSYPVGITWHSDDPDYNNGNNITGPLDVSLSTGFAYWTSTQWWQTIRLFLGFGVYLGYVWLMVHLLFPKQMV